MDIFFVSFVINEEGKINGMQGNRRLENDIIAGPFFIIRDDGEDYSSLTNEDINKYMEQFKNPDTDISQEEIDNLVRYSVIGFDNTDEFYDFLEGMNLS